MKNSGNGKSLDRMLEEILSFIGRTSGLTFKRLGQHLEVSQKCDMKTLKVNVLELSEVLSRTDGDGKEFIQINLLDGRKILLTESLIGFKPFESLGLDMTKLPKVVTTPDLTSVLEAIEDALSSEWAPDNEVEVLKKVFNSILLGGELVGFDLHIEKKWLDRVVTSNLQASA